MNSYEHIFYERRLDHESILLRRSGRAVAQRLTRAGVHGTICDLKDEAKGLHFGFYPSPPFLVRGEGRGRGAPRGAERG